MMSSLLACRTKMIIFINLFPLQINVNLSIILDLKTRSCNICQHEFKICFLFPLDKKKKFYIKFQANVTIQVKKLSAKYKKTHISYYVLWNNKIILGINIFIIKKKKMLNLYLFLRKNKINKVLVYCIKTIKTLLLRKNDILFHLSNFNISQI